MPPSIAREPTPDWLNKKNHPAAFPQAGDAGGVTGSKPLMPTLQPSVGTAMAQKMSNVHVAAPAAAPAAPSGSASGTRWCRWLESGSRLADLHAANLLRHRRANAWLQSRHQRLRTGDPARRTCLWECSGMVLLVEPVGRGLSGYRRRHRTGVLAVAVIDAQLPIGLGISHDVVVLACHRCDRSADLLRGNRHSRGGGECSGKHTRIRKCAGTLPSKIQTLKLGYVKQCNVKSTIAKKNRKTRT